MSKNAGNIVLEAKNVVYYYKANKGKKVLDDISYGFEIGKMYAILGPSGSGKTTFLSLLALNSNSFIFTNNIPFTTPSPLSTPPHSLPHIPN